MADDLYSLYAEISNAGLAFLVEALDKPSKNYPNCKLTFSDNTFQLSYARAQSSVEIFIDVDCSMVITDGPVEFTTDYQDFYEFVLYHSVPVILCKRNKTGIVYIDEIEHRANFCLGCIRSFGSDLCRFDHAVELASFMDSIGNLISKSVSILTSDGTICINIDSQCKFWPIQGNKGVRGLFGLSALDLRSVIDNLTECYLGIDPNNPCQLILTSNKYRRIILKSIPRVN